MSCQNLWVLELKNSTSVMYSSTHHSANKECYSKQLQSQPHHCQWQYHSNTKLLCHVVHTNYTDYTVH